MEPFEDYLRVMCAWRMSETHTPAQKLSPLANDSNWHIEMPSESALRAHVTRFDEHELLSCAPCRVDSSVNINGHLDSLPCATEF